MHVTPLLAASCAILCGMLSVADVLTPALGQVFQKKIVLIRQHAEARPKTPQTTSFLESELNSYLKFNAADLLPTGLTDPVMTLLGDGRVAARAVVDLDVVRQKQSRGSWFDPTSYLTGTLPVTAVGTIVTEHGEGRFEFERVEVSGVPVPKALLAQMVNFFTRTDETPQGASLDDTFELPARIRQIVVGAGRFSVIQ